MHTDYAEEGLVIPGVNYSDSPEHARKYLDDNDVTFPSVLDTSDAATKVTWRYETLIGMTAVPMSYLIDKQGKVVEAWYGVHNKQTVRKALRLLY